MSDSPRPFVHLHCHSEYSILDGAGKLKNLVQRAVELGMNALALTDHGNLYGARKFYKLATDAGIKPIIGYEAYVAPGSRFDKHAETRREATYHLTLLSMNHKGYENLLRLASLASLEGFYYKPRIDRDLLEKYGEGLIVLSGCLAGEVNRALVGTNKPDWEKARSTASWYRSTFGDRYYFELQNNGILQQQQAARYMIQLSQEMNIPLVATSDVHYVLPEDADIQDILLCINTKRQRADTDRMRMETREFYLRAPEEMYAAFPGQEEAVARSQEIADRCMLELESGKRCFPVYQTPPGVESIDFLRKTAYEGLRDRYSETPKRWKDGKIGGELSDEVLARLDKELDTIKRQGFPNYFLIVWDFVRAARSKGITCTARGSGVGSLVCFGLAISRVCPLEYSLLFERFLDVNRKEAPDIDVDFEKERRGEIIQYVKDVYGEDSVAQLGTFGTMAAKAAINDVGRVLGMPLQRVKEVTSRVPSGPKVTIKKALDANPELREMYENDKEIHELIDYAKGCEGLIRNTSTHACAVVITPAPVVQFAPIQLDSSHNGVVTQWEQTEVEDSGLLKMDFLGLRNLTILSETMRLIEETTGQKLDPYRFPIDDKPTYELISRGETLGVFQLESGGFRNLLKRFRPDNLKDIIAALALYRPGPLDGGLVDQYIDVKHGRSKATYMHPVMEDELKETHGVMVYQEQIMRILNRLGNIELPDAYKCIKAIGKKKLEIIAKYQAKFIEGCQEHNLTAKDGDYLFGLIQKFAGYGFNKSHSTAYAKIAYMTAYLKRHFSVEFMTALLNGDIAGRNFAKKDKTVLHVEDCHRMGVEVLPPSVNSSGAKYLIENGKIHFALCAIKGCSETAANAIYNERKKNGPFKDIFDFCERISAKSVPKATLLTLLYAGAFDCFGASRAQMEAGLDQALQAGESRAADREKGQMSLFGMVEDSADDADAVAAVLPNVPEWSIRDRLRREKEVLGFYVSGHPLDEYRALIQKHRTHTLEDAATLENQAQVVVCGSIATCAVRSTKKDQKLFGTCTLEDESGQMQAVMWSDTYSQYGQFLKPDAIVAIVGTIDNRELEKQKKAEALLAAANANASTSDDDDDSDDDVDMPVEDDDDSGSGGGSSGGGESSTQLIIDRIVPIESLQTDFNDGLAVCLREEEHTPDTVKMLYEILRSTPGSDRVNLIVILGERRVVMDCDVHINTTPELVERTKHLLGERNVHVLSHLLRPEPRQERPRRWGKKLDD